MVWPSCAGMAGGARIAVPRQYIEQRARPPGPLTPAAYTTGVKVGALAAI